MPLPDHVRTPRNLRWIISKVDGAALTAADRKAMAAAAVKQAKRNMRNLLISGDLEDIHAAAVDAGAIAPKGWEAVEA